MSEEVLNDKVLGRYLLELTNSDLFKVQIELEKRTIASFINKLQSLDLKSDTLDIDYTTVRSQIDGIKRLIAVRNQLIEESKTRDSA